MSNLGYCLVTPAKDEEKYISLTIDTVVAQTVKPTKWIIVSDGSTDQTEAIVSDRAKEFPWIELVSLPSRNKRDFGGKAKAFEAGYKKLMSTDCELIGNLDADISLLEDHYEFLIKQFILNSKLGIAGTPFLQGNQSYDFRYSSVNHVSGACQLFRKECYASIGGYLPMERGGIDVVAVLTARMNGWDTKTFVEKPCTHHRTMGTAEHSVLRANFRLGVKDYALGRHPLWQISRSIYQMTRKPFFVMGFTILLGYFWGAIARVKRPVPKEVVKFQRNEQMDRLKLMLSRS